MTQGWKEVPLGEVCRVVPGFAFKSKDWCDNGIPVVKIKNIGSDRSVDMSSSDHVPKHLLTEKIEKFVLRDGDILIAMTGATAGKVGKLRTSRPCLLNQRVAKIEPVSADKNFIWSVVSSDRYQDIFFRLADGAAQPNMSGVQIEGVKVLLPPSSTQERIASILSAYDDLIENNTKRIKILEEMARALYREWFVHFRFPGHEKVKLVDSAMGKIPEGWRALSIKDVADNFDRKRKPLSKKQRATMQGIYPYYGAAKVFDYVNDYLFDGRYLLIAEDGSVTTTDRKPVLQMATGKFWVNNHTHILQGCSPFSTDFVYMTLGHVDITPYITGAAQPKVTQANMNRIPVVGPPVGILGRFDDHVGPMLAQVDLLGDKNAVLRQARDLLLPKLISGQINVDELDLPEAA